MVGAQSVMLCLPVKMGSIKFSLLTGTAVAIWPILAFDVVSIYCAKDLPNKDQNTFNGSVAGYFFFGKKTHAQKKKLSLINRIAVVQCIKQKVIT